MTEITDNQDLYWVFYDLFSSPQVWFLLFVCMILAILPDLVVYAVEKLMDKRSRFRHLEKTRLQELEYEQRNQPQKYSKPRNSLDRTSKNLRPIANVARKQRLQQREEQLTPEIGYINGGSVAYTNHGFTANIEPVNTRVKQKTAQPDTVSLYSVFYRF